MLEELLRQENRTVRQTFGRRVSQRSRRAPRRQARARGPVLEFVEDLAEGRVAYDHEDPAVNGALERLSEMAAEVLEQQRVVDGGAARVKH